MGGAGGAGFGGAGGPGFGGYNGGSAPGGDDNVVDADFTVVDED